MDTVAGEWIMKGCSRRDPDCLHTPEDLLDLIQKIGFLPLFSGAIEGFSVEEHTPAADWWSDDPARDPWAWRQLLAPNPQVAYGKFFDRKAGFVSREWFPVFANCRRDGYDYEGFYQDGKMNARCHRVLMALSPDENAVGQRLLSSELRKQAALEKGFDGALTELQMKTFLLMSDFRRKTNRRGEPYGWHVAEIMTPETKWGYEEVNACREPPEASRQRMADHIRRFYPDASDKALRQVLG